MPPPRGYYICLLPLLRVPMVPLRAPMDPPPFGNYIFLLKFFAIFPILGAFFSTWGAFLLLFSPYGNFFCPYTGPLCYFSSIGGPFCYVFLYMTILRTFLPCGGLFATFFLYNDYIGNIFYHVGAFLLYFSPFGGLFCPYIARLCYFSSMCVAFCCIFLYIGNIFTMWGGAYLLFFFPFGGPFLGLPPLLRKFLRTYCHPTPYNYGSNNGIPYNDLDINYLCFRVK